MSVLHRIRIVRATCLVLAALVVFPATMAAQQPPATPSIPSAPLTLDQVLELAAGRSETIAIAQTGIRRAEGDQVRARSALFPQLTLSGGYDRALASEFSGLFDNFSGSGGGDPGTDNSSDLSDLPFGRANTWRLSLGFSQNLYTGGRVGLERLAVDHEGDLDDVRNGRAPVLLDGQLDVGVTAVVQDPLQSGQLALGVPPDVVGDVDVLALDDRPHGHLPRGGSGLIRVVFGQSGGG